MTTGTIDYAMPRERPPHDRKVGLLLFGVLAIVLGAGSGCLALMTPLVLIVPQPTLRAATSPATSLAARPSPPPVSNILIGLAFYAVVSAVLITLGVNSCRCKRYVRPLFLCLSWPWLIMGLIGVLIYFFIMPEMAQQMHQQMKAQLPANSPATAIPPVRVLTIALAAGGAFFALLGIVIPAAFVLFYRSRHVETTLAFYDPYPNWADRCPTPVLGLSIWLIVAAVMSLFMLPAAVAPAFGVFVTGPLALGILFIIALLLGYAGYACYRQQMIGWVIAIALSLAVPASWFLTIHRKGMLAYYQTAGFPPDQIEQMKAYTFVNNPAYALVGLLPTILAIAFLLYVLRHFRGPKALDQ